MAPNKFIRENDPDKQDLAERKKNIRQQFGGYNYLIVDSYSSRRSVRALLRHVGVPHEQIEMVSRVDKATELLDSRKYQIVFVDFESIGEPHWELLDVYLRNTALNKPNAFFIIANGNVRITLDAKAEKFVDGIISKPFNFSTIKRTVVGVLSEKLGTTPYYQAVNSAKKFAEGGYYEQAIRILSLARNLGEENSSAYYQEGLIYHKLNRLDEAIRCFESCLELNHSHERCMIEQIGVLCEGGAYSKANVLAQRIMRSQSMPLRLIPYLVKLSIYNSKFERVIDYARYGEFLLKDDTGGAACLAAGLVVYGIRLISKNDRARGLDALKKAELYCGGSAAILKKILYALIAGGFQSEVDDFLSRIPPELVDHREVKIAELECFERTAVASAVLERSLKLIGDGIHDDKLYKIAIKNAAKINDKQELVNELIAKAADLFPEKQSTFMALLDDHVAVVNG